MNKSRREELITVFRDDSLLNLTMGTRQEQEVQLADDSLRAADKSGSLEAASA
tara:strand:- start:94 stop:252 length:159 start_codon:yes stop_codon:yes gene_type:complete